MRTWSEISAKLSLFLSKEVEAGGKELKSEPLRIESWNWAQRVFVHHTPLRKSVQLEVESDGRTAILPSDLLLVERLYDSEYERYWWPVKFGHGDIRYDDDDTLQFWEWGSLLHLGRALDPANCVLTVYYLSYYPDVEYSITGNVVSVTQPTILTPDWAELALFHLVAANVMQPMEITSSDISQYKIRVESGNPEHNPRAQSALYHLKWYDHLVGLMPPVVNRRQQ